MQHIKTYMGRINTIIKNNGVKQPKKQVDDTGVSDKNIRVVASIVHGIREAREEMLNGK
jgi:hypothetical protein